MSTKRKPKKPQESPEAARYESIVLIDDSDVDLFSSETLLKEIHLSKHVKREISPKSVIDNLKTAKRLDQIPELIFIDLKMKKMDGYKFLDEFNHLSDFVRKKCKIVVMSNDYAFDEKKRIMLHPNVIYFLVKPLDAFQLKGFFRNPNK